MSGSRLVRNSPDLTRLLDEGYSIRVVNGYLVVDDIPFVNDAAEVRRGAFLCPLDLHGDRTAKPSTHVMCFVGGEPRDKNGQPIDGLINTGVERWAASPDLVAVCGFSQKPQADGYSDYYEKVSYYAAMVVNQARALDLRVSALTAKAVATDEDDGVFVYVDTFSSRAGITTLNENLAMRKAVIVGLGGTGGYLLDLLAKTPIHEIHLYDDDIFGTHNAFRAPGAASLEDLRAGLMKVGYYERTYARMHRGIRPHAVHVTSENVAELLDADFVFLTMDSNPDKKTIVEALTDARVPFIDTGIGVSNDSNGIAGQIRVTTSTPGRTGHISRNGLISYVAGDDAEYDTNLQVAELNMMAAVQAIMRFKKLRGFYADAEDERHSVYVTHTNEIHSRYGQTDLSTAAASADPTDDHEPEVAA
ncbi:ThiF family adenylyltransferase [Pseudonocardia sp. GCM10023141]|uniref:ThiF family adenylyltransferase n=1 Tax=Pseudonocardia sp. GCM10023141 TaxID=3252653 RepID=UPI00360CD012